MFWRKKKTGAPADHAPDSAAAASLGEVRENGASEGDGPNGGVPVPDKLKLLADIKEAHRLWLNAQMRLDWVDGEDEVDLAIYSLVAAEKNYEMLLRQAKRLTWTSSDLCRQIGRGVHRCG